MKFIEKYRTFIHTDGKNDVASAIVKFVLSAWLIFGFKYLGYDLIQDYQKYVELSSVLERHQAERELHQSMVEVVNSNWYLVPSNAEKEFSLFSLLVSLRDTQELPKDFVISAKSWCQESYIQTSSDLARIESFQFTFEPLQKYKGRHLKIYNANRAVTVLICDLVNNWSSLSQESRNQAIENIFSTEDEIKIVFASIEAEGNQIEWEIEQLATEEKRVKDEKNWVFALTALKTLLSALGIGAGLYTIKLFFEKENLRNKKTSRKQKAG